MTREQAWADLKALTRARKILRVRGATVGTPTQRTRTDEQIERVCRRLRAICRPRLVGRDCG